VPLDALPPDPFADDPYDPATELDAEHQLLDRPIQPGERAELLADLADLTVYQTLLQPRGYRGLVVDCGNCDEPHYHDWQLLRSSLEQLLSDGHMRPHEPAFDPNPADYASWDYCRGFADGITASQNAY
jgi:hypothetical protein